MRHRPCQLTPNATPGHPRAASGVLPSGSAQHARSALLEVWLAEPQSRAGFVARRPPVRELCAHGKDDPNARREVRPEPVNRSIEILRLFLRAPHVATATGSTHPRPIAHGGGIEM